MLAKTIDYLDAFSRFKKKENVEAVERLLTAHTEFHKFERAQLGMCSSCLLCLTPSSTASGFRPGVMEGPGLLVWRENTRITRLGRMEGWC